MRMWDITFLIICFELAIGFTTGIGLFGHAYYTQSQQSVSSTNGFMSGDISSTGDLLGATQAKTVDYFTISASMLWAGIGVLINIVISVTFFLPHLVKTFMFPMELAVVIQALIYACYAWSIAQYLTGRMGGNIQ